MERGAIYAVLLPFLLIAMCAWAHSGEFPEGLGLDLDLENALRNTLVRLSESADQEEVDLGKMAELLAPARKHAEHLASRAESRAKPAEIDRVELPAVVAFVLPGESSPDEVRELWRQQLRMNITAAQGLLDGADHFVREWVGWPLHREQANRARPLAEALREADKLVGLLSRSPDQMRPFQVKRADLLFSDDFAEGTGQWLMFGDTVTSHEDDAFRMKDRRPRHPDAMMWTRKTFEGNFVASFTFIPHSRDDRAGALFAICGRPRGDNTLAVSVGPSMDTYNRGIDGYHFSMHRGTTGKGNVRRVGPGLKMLASGPDPCPTPGRSYEVSIGKFGPAIFLIVDGKLIHHWYDAATFGEVLTSGHIGIRHWAGMDASYRNFKVHRLVEEPAEVE